MSAVSASPGAVQRLADTVSAGAESLTTRSAALAAALDEFYASASEYGPRSSPIADALQREAGQILGLSHDLDRFVTALRAADQAGAALRIGRFGLGWGRDMLLVDDSTLAVYAPLAPGATLGQLIIDARGWLEAHRRTEPPLNPRARAVHLNWSRQLQALQRRLRQLERLVNPPHPGWAGAGSEQWASAQDLLDALALGRARAAQASESSGPFLAAALDSEVLLTPGRVDMLTDLDVLATMPLDDFLSARDRAREDRPFYDWSADGCSGPIPQRAQDTCLRHDFLYRNSRMLRDQWGTTEGFALDIKDDADNRFGDELRDTYSWWERTSDPGLGLWVIGAEAAVTTVGSVDAPWAPRDPDDFYGEVEEHH